MNFAKRYRNSQILFGISLLFLVGFLVVWLKNVHQDKVDELQTEASYLWIKSINEIEGADFAKLIFKSVGGRMDSLIIKHYSSLDSQTLEGLSPIDSITSSNFSIQGFNKEEEIQIIVASDSTIPSYAKFEDSNNTSISQMDIKMMSSRFLAPELENYHDSIIFDLGFIQDQKSIFSNFALDINLVKLTLDSALEKTALPIQYQIIDLNNPTKSFHTEEEVQYHNDRFFVETATGNQYSLKISGYESYVFKQMWFEFLMSSLLLMLISTTFYYILNNLKEQNRLVTIKNDLISNITHELRTPIFTVSAALEALESFNGLSDRSRTKEYLSISKNELNRLSILVEKVLKTSLFEQEALQIKYETFSLNHLLDTIANSLKLQLEKQQATLNVNIPETNVELYADKIHITNVIYNLIDNALKYSAEAPPVITIQLQKIDNNIQLVISDNGIGIPSAYLNEIFNKFFRVPQGNQHNIKGYGLGLNYVSNIIKQHQGSIRVKSQEGLGTTFTILLPKNSAVCI